MSRFEGAGHRFFVERTALDVEHDCAPFRKDLRNGLERQDAPPPDKGAVASDRDSFTIRVVELDKSPDSSPIPCENGVSLSHGEEFSDEAGIAPTRHGGFSHQTEYCRKGCAGGVGNEARPRPLEGLLQLTSRIRSAGPGGLPLHR